VSVAHPVFVLHEHHLPQHHFDLRLEEDGVLRSWAVPKGMPTDPAHNRLAVPVDDHELAHATYEDATKRIADNGWWELEDRDERGWCSSSTVEKVPVGTPSSRPGPTRYCTSFRSSPTPTADLLIASRVVSAQVPLGHIHCAHG
jgi:hypothetical protein